MELFATQSVVDTIKKLEKKPSYSDLRLLFYDYICKHPSFQDWDSSARLSNMSPIPHIRIRLGGRGGYRVYYVLILKNDEVIISGLHPKTGKKQKSTFSNEEIKASLREALSACRSRDLMLPITLDHDNKTIIF